MNRFAQLAITLPLCACAMPFHYGNYGGGPLPPAARDLRIADARLSPDGKTILFAFQEKTASWRIARASTDPADSKITILDLPKMDSWINPAFGPEAGDVAAVSYCMGAPCYADATGYQVWVLHNGGLKRLTPDTADLRRADPVFGTNGEDVYWFISDARKYPNVHLDVSERYLAHMEGGRETVVFPKPPAGGSIFARYQKDDPAELRIISAHGAGRYDDRYYFAAMTTDGASPAAKAALDKPGRFKTALYRHSKDGFERVEPEEVEYADAPRGGDGYAAMAHHFIKEHTNAVADFYAKRGSTLLWSFRFHGPAYSLSASADLSTAVFTGERGVVENRHWRPLLQESIFLWHQGMDAPQDLNLPERLKALLEDEPQSAKIAQNRPGSPQKTGENQSLVH